MLLKDGLPDFVEKAKANFAKDKFLTPVFIAMIDNHPQFIIMKMKDQQEKESFSQKIQGLIAKNKLTEYIMITEAWTAEVHDITEIRKWLANNGSLENYPNRKEIVSILYASSTEEIQYTADINRGIIPPVLDNWQTSERKIKVRPEEFSSRFSGLFTRSKAGNN